MRLTRKGFKAWLESFHPRTKVCKSGYGSNNCPLANYFGDGTTVSAGYIRRPWDNSLQVPRHNIKWVHDFVLALDKYSYKNTGNHQIFQHAKSVSAGKALKILEETSGRSAVVQA